MLQQSNFVKIHIAVPVTHAEMVREAFGQAGAGARPAIDIFPRLEIE